MLDRILVSLRDGGIEVEMGGEHLNLTAKEKLAEKDIQGYKYWLFERNMDDTFANLIEWLEMKVQILDETMDERKVEQSSDRRRNRGFRGTTNRKQKGCIVKSCKSDHPPWVCQSFKKLSVPERKELISRSGRCYRCLAMGHQSKNCTSERKCGVDGCSSIQHSRFLHVERGPKQRDDNQEATPPDNETKEPLVERTHIANRADHISLMVISAIISNGRSRLKINAMLDPCSNGTYVTKSTAQQLNLQGQRQSLTISGTGGSEIRKQSARVKLTVSNLDGRLSSKVQANVLDNITGDTPAIRWSELKEKWPHLKTFHSKTYLGDDKSMF